jgi:magnesium transporter
MNVGEVGNFISYAFAPASIVAPLGTVSFLVILLSLQSQPRQQQFALMANCFFAPLMLRERFRKVISWSHAVFL